MTTVGVALGVAVILATAIANRSTITAFKSMIDSITGKADFWISGASEGGFDADKLSVVRGVDGVKEAVPGIAKGATLKFKSKKPVEIQVVGIDPDSDRRVRDYRLTSGRFIEKGEAGLLLPRRLADERKVKVGSAVTVAFAGRRHQFMIVGLLKDEGAGRFQAGQAAYVPLARAQRIFDRGGRLDFIDVQVDEGRSVKAVLDRTAEVLGPGFVVERPEKRVEAIAEMLRGLQVGISFFGAIAMFVGAFLVYNTFAMVVVEQTHELGILRALGGSRGQTTRVVLAQAAVLGLVGGVFGIGLGFALAKLLLGYVSKAVNLPLGEVSAPLPALFAAPLAGLVVTLAGAAQPALLAGRISPMAAIRLQGQDRPKRRTWLTASIALTGLGFGIVISLLPRLGWIEGYGRWAVPVHETANFLFLLGAAILSPLLIRPLAWAVTAPVRTFFGPLGRWTAGNLVKNTSRTAATAATIMVTLAMLMSVYGMTTSFRLSVERWVDKSLGADVYVGGQNEDTVFTKGFVNRLSKIKGVKDATALRLFPARSGDSHVLVRAIEPQSYRRFASLQFVDADKGEWKQFQRTDNLFISAAIANRKKLSPGDKFELLTKTGPRLFTIAGVTIDFGGETGDLVIIDRAAMKKYFDLDDFNAVRLKAAENARPESIAREIEKKYASMYLRVRDAQEFKDMVDRQVVQAFAVFNVLLFLAAVVAVISVFNTLTMNIMERRREIGVLRAVGATQNQIGLINILEAFTTGAIGALIGFPVGAFLAGDIVTGMKTLTGYEITFVFPWAYSLGAAAAAVILSVAAAVYPGYKAARLVISEALQYE